MLENHVVLVTGAARGMGEAVATTCHDRGAHLVLVDVDPQVEHLAARLGATGVIGDVTDSDLARRTVAEAVHAHGSVTGLVNVAGIHAHGGVAVVTDEDWDRVLAVNLTGPMTWMRAAIPAMVEAGGGSVVNFGSIAGSHGRPDCAAYVASKSGLLGLTRSAARDYGHASVRVNTLSPGTIDTPMFREHEAKGGSNRNDHLPRIPLGRLGTTDDIANVTAFLLSDDSAYVSGLDVVVDGGRVSWT
jgi:NAD(P)-dependent dehydrogenase (short-subunit alcohol dehydrogenase family)